MATNRISFRNRFTGAQRVSKTAANENATTVTATKRTTATGAVRLGPKDVSGGKQAVVRTALGEVTTKAINREKAPKPTKFDGKDPLEAGHKRSRSSSLAAATVPQRVPLGPTRNVVPADATTTAVATQQPTRAVARAPRPSVARAPSRVLSVHEEDEAEVEPPSEEALPSSDDVLAGERDVKTEGPVPETDDEGAVEELLEEEEEERVEERVGQKRSWPEMDTQCAKRCRREVEQIREVFEDEVDVLDPTMVSEYSEDIFKYMEELELEVMPNPDYIDGQTEITWQMRETLVDWLLQVHLRYHMLPETLWIAINIVDRFLSRRVVSLVKLQLVGVTAMFVAAKYEEILAPSVDEFVFLTEGGYTREEILKGESIVLQTLEFNVSGYCSPYSWMRRISKADDYDIQTRTLGKFITEVTLLDHRFLAAKPSLVAAVGMYCARRMLGGDWTEAFIFYSGFTEDEVRPGHRLLVDKLSEEGIDQTAVYKKYAHKKFLKASTFAVDWARANYEDECVGEEEDLFE